MNPPRSPGRHCRTPGLPSASTAADHRWRSPMDMEVTAWNSLYTTMTAQEERRPISRATLRRIATFARPHRRQLGWFLLLSVVTAALAVATPVLAGQVVDAIVGAAEPSIVVGLAVLIAVLAV